MAKPLRLLIVTHNYPRFLGDPAGAFVARLAAGAARRGHDVRVLAPHAAGLATSEVQDGVRLERFRYAPDRLEWVAYTGDLHRRAWRSAAIAAVLPIFLRQFRRAVRQSVAAFDPHVIHAHWWMPSGFAAVGHGVPALITVHGSDVRLLDHKVGRWFGGRVLGKASAITAVSQFLANDLRTALPAVSNRIQVGSMPIDLSYWRPAQTATRRDPPVVLYAGNLIASKGVDILIKACARLARRGVPFRLRIIGEGTARANLAQLAAEIGLEQIEWSDFVRQERMIDEFGAATVVVLPTLGRAEGLGLVLVEATLAGCAVVGSTAGGIPEVIEDGRTGRLVPPGDVPALEQALSSALSDQEERRRWIAEGQRRAMERFDLERAMLPYLELYARLAGNPNSN